jgi:hypothetical protein
VVAQAFEKSSIGGGEGVSRKFGARYPDESVAGVGLRFRATRREGAAKEQEADVFFRVGVSQFFDHFPDNGFDAEFLAQFADEALLKGFTWLALAAGKFPQAAKVVLRAALGE